MKLRTLRQLVTLLLLTLFCQTLQAAVRSVQCDWVSHTTEMAQPVPVTSTSAHSCHESSPATDPIGERAADHIGADHFAHHENSSNHCQPGCSCCWSACSASLLNRQPAAAPVPPSTESYTALSALLPASPVEQALRPPRAA